MKKINNGTAPEKVSKHWKLIWVFQRIQGLRIISLHHVHRKAKKLLDLLANQGVNCIENKVLIKWQELHPRRMKALCCEKVEEDKEVFRQKAIKAN